METLGRHYERWRADLATATAFAGSMPDNDWLLVMRFYAAMHLTTAYLLIKDPDFDPKRHDDRREAIDGTSELSTGRGFAFKAAFRWLKDVSEQVRYEPGFVARPVDFQNSVSKLSTIQSFILVKVKAHLGIP